MRQYLFSVPAEDVVLTRRQLVLVEKVHDHLEDEELETLFKRREVIDDEVKALTLKEIQLLDELEELDEKLHARAELLWRTTDEKERRSW